MASLPARRRRHDPRRPDRAAHLPESGEHGRGHALLRGGPPRPAHRRADPPVRAGDPQLRPVHLLRDTLPAPAGGPGMTAGPETALVVGVGNPVRGDDGVGPAVAALVRAQARPDVEVAELHGDLTALLDLW